MSNSTVGDAAIAVVRRNTEEVQGKGNWDLFEDLFADDFADHAPQPGTTPDKDGGRGLYKRRRAAFPDFRPEIPWQAAAGDLVTTYKTYHGTHQGEFLGIPATGKKVSFYTVDAMRVVDGKITEHWGVATLLEAARHRLPTIYPYRFFTVDGGLMSYGSDVLGSYRRAASYVDRILRGAKVAELPVQTPIKNALTKTVKTLGLDMPPTLLERADELIDS